MTDDVLLAAYDDQLRGDAETAGAASVERLGPLWLVRFTGRGFISYRDLDGADEETPAGWCRRRSTASGPTLR
ncbi:hypothetical protein [Nocardioides sp. TF02-7]|uniref:hypothetical protein n=1 Tax=Nocardioides sp. TF02-7 TaxID=2917724 RepID=UPI001F053FC7|nr:hypothetical protein [Nocardioides sp. TF02-7]UMG91455.1 hypothetical protein MF408_15110 [Nocardioides sp. TF02-7]